VRSNPTQKETEERYCVINVDLPYSMYLLAFAVTILSPTETDEAEKSTMDVRV
jgi:hypothetical protein